MSAAHRAEAPAPLGWRIATVLAVVFGLFILAQDFDWTANLADWWPRGSIGVQWAPMTMGSGAGRITAVTPGLPAAAAGVVPGDVVAFHPAWRIESAPAVGEPVTVTVTHGGQVRRIVLVAAPGHEAAVVADRRDELFATLADIPAVLLGLLILIRGRARPAPVLLGISLISFGMSLEAPSPTLGGAVTFLPVRWIDAVDFYLVFVAFLAFALVMLDSVAGARRWRWAAFGALAVLLAVAAVERSLVDLGVHTAFEAFALKHAPFSSLSIVSLAATLVVLAVACWRAPHAERQRLGLLTAAFGCIVLNQAWFQIASFLPNQEVVDLIASGWTLAMDALAGIVAPALFAYAILRHRVLDLGFALNRTLVYSGVSAIMLGAFGLIEWAVDHFVKIQGRGENALIDAAIALGVYLAFHRVTGVVEHVVETLFFHRWREKEAQLRRFVADAAFITRPEALTSAFVGAAARFSDVAGAAVYLAQAGGDYRRAEGSVTGLPDVLDANDPALVRARGEHKPVEPDAVGSRLAAGLVCPMVQRNEVIGLLLLAPRAEGQAFRPDEIDLLGWATQQVGLDLHALETEQLQAAVARLEHQLEGARLVGRPA